MTRTNRFGVHPLPIVSRPWDAVTAISKAWVYSLRLRQIRKLDVRPADTCSVGPMGPRVACVIMPAQ